MEKTAVRLSNRKDVFVLAITKDTLIGDILDMDRTTAPYFLEMGMHCLGCPSARGETGASLRGPRCQRR